MTVSPRWPQDGNRPSDAAYGVNSKDPRLSPALPPTLFQLRNLNPVKSVPQEPVTVETAELGESASQIAASAPEVAESTPPDQPQSPASCPSPTPASECRTPSTTHAGEELKRQPPIPPVTVTTPAPPKRSPNLDQPAGRTWMERLGSNAAVIVLLLVVVAAALLAGRDSSDEPTDSALAEHGDRLKFDEDGLVDLPMAAQASPPDFELAFNDPVEPAAVDSKIPAMTATATPESAIPESAAIPATNADPDADMTAQMVPYQSTRTSNAPEFAFPEGASRDAVAKLETPQLNAESTTVAGSAEDIDFLSENRVQVNEFFHGGDEVDVLAASNRTTADNTDSTLPSLEDLVDRQTSTETTNPAPANKPRLSKMPAGINNLLQYLPELPNGQAADQD